MLNCWFPSWRLPPGGIRLRVALIVPFLLLVLGIAGLTSFIAHRGERWAIEDMADQLLRETGQRIEQRLADYLGTARQLLATNVAALRLSLLDARNPAMLEAYLFQQLLAFPTINGVMLTTEQKDFLVASRWDKGLAIRLYNGARRDGLYNYRVEAQGQRQELIWLDTGFDPHNDPPGHPWYAAVKNAGKPHWRLVVGEIEAQRLFLILSYMTPFDDSHGELAGITAVSLYLSQVGDFLRGLQIGQTGQAFIVDRDGLLIATSTGEPPFKPYVESENHERLNLAKRRLNATDSQNPRTRAASRYLSDAAGGFERLTDARFFKATLDDQPHFLRIIPFSDANLDWRIVVAMPESAVMGGIDANHHNMDGLNSIWLILVLLLGLWIARLITRPILALNANASRLARGDFLESSTTSSITELQQLTDSFKFMATRLNESFNALQRLNRTLADHQERLEEIIAQRTEALRQSEAYFRNAFEYTAVGMALVSLPGQFLKVNKAFCEMLGYSAAELIERSLEQITFPDDLPKDLHLARQTMTGAIPWYQLEKRYVHKQGHIVWGLLSASTVRDDDGRPLYGVGQIQDITERRRMEEALRDANQRLEQRVKERTAELERTVALLERESAARRESAERLTQALHAAHAGAWEWNATTNRAIWSDDNYRVLGLAPGNVEASYEHWLRCIHPDDRAEVERRVAQTMARDDELTMEFRVVWPDGGIHWISDVGKMLYDPAGDPVGMYGIQMDITERKHAELALREVEAQYRQLVENQPDLICRFLPDTTLTFVNTAYARFFGHPPAALLGQRFIEFIGPDAQAEVWRNLAALTSMAPARQYEYPSVNAAGVIRWHLWHDFAFFDEQDNVTGFQSIGVDITALKQAEEARRDRETMFKTVLETIPVRVFWKDREGRYLGCNTAFARDAGYHTAEELLNRDDFQMGWLDQAELYRADDHSVIATGIAKLNFEEPQTTPDGQQIWLRTSKIPLRALSGEIIGILGTYEDITERKRMEQVLRESEERMRLFFERQVVGMAITSPEKGWLQVNDRLCAMLGYSREELRRLTWVELTHPEDLAPDIAQFERLLASNIDKYTLEKRFIRQDGQLIHVNLTVTCVRRADGAVDYVLALLEDITDRKRAERELLDTMECLEREIQSRRDQEAQLLQARKLEAIGRLTGGIAHDFNNLLTVIKGNLELLRSVDQAGSDSDRALLIEDAQSAVRQGAELTAGLLAFSRQQPLQPKRTRVNRLVEGLHRLLERVLGPAIVLRVTMAPALPDVLADPGQFQAALMNLLINAQDAMPDGGVLDVRAATILVHPGAAAPVADLAPGQYVVVSVADSGIGMDDETLARACEPFFTTKPLGQGTGLGLSTVYGFTTQSQGGLTLESQPGQGTTVRLFLPALEPASRRPAELPPAPPSVLLPLSLARGAETLLVVEDETRVRRLACRYLRELGYTVLEAADAEDALVILETEPEIRLVFSDIVMPGALTGYDLARWITVHRPEVKCLLTTGYHDRAQTASAGDALPPILAKPYGKEQLARQIRQRLDNP